MNAASARQTPEHWTAALGSFISALGDPAMVLDGDQCLVHANMHADRRFDEMVEGRVVPLLQRKPEATDAIASVIETGLPKTVSFVQRAPSEVWYEASVARLNGPGEVEHTTGGRAGILILVVLRDFTAQIRSDRMRSDFIANASHELRTPLTSLSGFIDTILGSAADDPIAQKKFMKIMQSQANRMARLIEGLLSLSRIEMKEHVLPDGVVDLPATVNEVVEGLRPLSESVNIPVHVSNEIGSCTVGGDQDELHQVFDNLIQNAIKYGAEGKKVDVRIFQPQEPSKYSWGVEVRDYGTGIADEHLPRLTERFYRVSVEASREKKGTGLGLAIVKHILTRHRGELVVSSKLGAGCRFTVFLGTKSK